MLIVQQQVRVLLIQPLIAGGLLLQMSPAAIQHMLVCHPGRSSSAKAFVAALNCLVMVAQIRAGTPEWCHNSLKTDASLLRAAGYVP